MRTYRISVTFHSFGTHNVNRFLASNDQEAIAIAIQRALNWANRKHPGEYAWIINVSVLRGERGADTLAK